MGEIYLIRHGQASFGEQNYDRLSGIGIAQSHRLGEWLRETGLGFDAVYSGERERQKDTALHALGDVAATPGGAPLRPALQVDPAFNELDADKLLQHAIPRVLLRDPGLAAMLVDLKANRDAFRKVFERIVDEWVTGAWETAGIGSWEDFSARVLAGIRALAVRHGTGSRLAIFTSGGPITATMQELDALPGAGLDWQIANTSITRLAYGADGSLTLLERRVVPHLREHPGLLTHL